MSVFDTVRENIPARKAFEHYGIRVNRNGMCSCPFHCDKHPSMKVDVRYYCFGCGEKGDAVDFVSKHFGLGLRDAAVKICEDFGLPCQSPGNMTYHPKAIPKALDDKLFQKTERYCFIVLSDYLHLLKRWKTEYAPVDETSKWHPYFVEALKEIDHVEYLLDTILYGNISDRAFLIADYGRKVILIERRLNELRSKN
ncbi:CHC2 zinc finger domain-containing protein [Butyrivibrio sp. YAB3001]|uniref:CHC2 zinc finger domain-containing protein n=1 Tax=Butyrivibrio sp. YAB3001 TaxID=1520812 RepID=UPI0008F685CF|nr:CHC2 zinc finger domain-containing protein [Butyrivibrio sp. YAB3001]SFC12267.1 CHC2 zinc finger [Butyrivibrio sp. YAB3001]